MKELVEVLQNGIPMGADGDRARRLCEQILNAEGTTSIDPSSQLRDTFKSCCDRVLKGCKQEEVTPQLLGDIKKLLTYLPSPSEEPLETMEEIMEETEIEEDVDD